MNLVAKTEIILIRHGETIWNLEERLQGQLDSPLTPLGIAQVQAVAIRLQDEKFSALYSSDSGRAWQTANAIATRTGHTIMVDARLREKHFGIVHGLTIAEVQANHPAIYAERSMHSPDYAAPEGESSRQMLTRGWAALNEIAARHRGERAVAVTHGGLISVVIRHILGVPLDQPRRFELTNASLHIIFQTDAVWQVETLGDVHHLRNLPALDYVNR